jgi:uncharacterized membrane protein YgaE (UPF0421/DUF939 family)
MRTNHMVFGLLLGAAISCMFFFFPFIEEETIFTIVMFNFLFISLTFPLNGTLQRKVCML